MLSLSGQSLPLAGCMRVPSPLQPSPASAVTFPQVPNLKHQEDPGQQIYRDIWVKGSGIFWFLTSWPRAKSLCFWLLSSCTQCLLPSRSGKCDQYSLSVIFIDQLWLLLACKERKGGPLQNFCSTPFTQEWGNRSRIWQKHKNLYCNNKTKRKHTKGPLQTLFLTTIISALAGLPIFWDSEM